MCGAGSRRGSPKPPNAQLHLPHLRALLGCGLQDLAACTVLMWAQPAAHSRLLWRQLSCCPCTLSRSFLIAVGPGSATCQLYDSGKHYPLVQLRKPIWLEMALHGLASLQLTGRGDAVDSVPSAGD